MKLASIVLGIYLTLSLAACATSTPAGTSVAANGNAPSSAAEATVAQPALHSGDVWIDRIQGGEREFRIEAVHGDTMEVSYWGTEQVTDPNLNIIVYRSLTQASSEATVSTKPGMWFVFPLYPGKTWVNDFDWEMKGAAPAKGSGEDKGHVIGWEDVQVPAGTFHALKVEVVTRFFGKGGMADEATLDFWYSPKVNRFVKFDYRSFYEGEIVAELVKYQPAKG